MLGVAQSSGEAVKIHLHEVADMTRLVRKFEAE